MHTHAGKRMRAQMRARLHTQIAAREAAPSSAHDPGDGFFAFPRRGGSRGAGGGGTRGPSAAAWGCGL